jgi:hypothetical protein
MEKAVKSVAEAYGIACDITTTGGSHARATFTHRGRSRFIHISRTPSHSAAFNMAKADARRACRFLLNGRTL